MLLGQSTTEDYIRAVGGRCEHGAGVGSGDHTDSEDTAVTVASVETNGPRQKARNKTQRIPCTRRARR